VGEYLSTGEAEGNRSGADPNCILLAGSGSRATRLRNALPLRWNIQSFDESACEGRGTLFLEAAGEQRHEQLAALRQISAAAHDEAVIISTSPILAHREIAASVTNPWRLIVVVPPWSNATSVCELIVGPETGLRAVNQAFDVARAAGWTPLIQRQGGPSALTRLFGAVLIESWNLSRRTGRPDAVDRAARQSGLMWSPLREIDRLGLARLSAAFDRAGQVASVDSIYASEASEAPSATFLANCGNDLIEEPVAIGYFLETALSAAVSLLTDGVMEDLRGLRRTLVAAYGRPVARRLSQALLARYPELTSGPFLAASV